MKEIIDFLKQRRNVKYSVWIIIFGLIFAFSFQANRAQIPQILEKPIRIVLGSEEARRYQVSGWWGNWAKGKESILKVSLPEERTYQMVVKAFSCSPPNTRDQRMEVHFNNVALDRLKFRKTSKWQKFSVNIPSYLLRETNTVKFIYREKIFLSPIAFNSLEFHNYSLRWGSLYLLFDSPIKRRINYLTLRVLSCSLGFTLLFWLFWLSYSRFLCFAVKMKFSRAIRIDFLSYLPSIVFLSLLALISFFSPYHFVYSFRTFFVLALAPTAILKLFPYKDLFLRFIEIIFRFILRAIEKTYIEVKKTLSFLKIQPVTFRRFLIRYHKIDLPSAFILDFMLLVLISALLSLIPTPPLVNGLAVLAYFFLAIGVVLKVVAFFWEKQQ